MRIIVGRLRSPKVCAKGSGGLLLRVIYKTTSLKRKRRIRHAFACASGLYTSASYQPFFFLSSFLVSMGRSRGGVLLPSRIVPLSRIGVVPLESSGGLVKSLLAVPLESKDGSVFVEPPAGAVGVT